jgi:Putative Zn-dependent protease, contains TPR repeats
MNKVSLNFDTNYKSRKMHFQLIRKMKQRTSFVLGLMTGSGLMPKSGCRSAVTLMSVLTLAGGLTFTNPEPVAARDRSKKSDESGALRKRIMSPDCEKATAEASKAWANGENDEAIRILKEAEKNCKDSEHLYLLLSTILVRMDKRQEEAAEAARRAVEINPDYVACYLQYGLCLMACDKNREAAQNFERLVKLDPTSYEAWSSMGRIYGELGEEKEARNAKRKQLFSSLGAATRASES